MNGFIYMGAGGLLIVWPGAVQTLLMDPPFVGHEGALFRALGMAVAVIGWLYLFGGRSGAPQFGPASVLDRLDTSSCRARTPGDRGNISPYAAGVCASRPGARHRRPGDSKPQGVSGLFRYRQW